MEPKRHLAVDIGAGSGRVYAGWLEDGALRAEEVHRFETGDVFLRDRRVRNLYRWYEEILAALGKYARRYGGELASVGVDAMGEDFALLDERGDLLALPPSYRDVKRDEAVLRLEEARFGNERLYALCGNQSVNADTLRQLLAMRLSRDGRLDRASALLFFADCFHYLLCGRACVEHSLASYGKLFDQRAQTWSDEIFRAFDLPESLKTPVVRCGEKLGEVHAAICEEAGLCSRPLVIAPCSHDTACAAFATPDEGEGWAFISSGSWSLVGIATKAPILTREAWRCNCSNSSMPIRKNMFKLLVAGMWLVQRCQREWGGPAFSEIVRLAAAAPERDCYFDPDAEALYNPKRMAEAIAALLNARCGAEIAADDVGAVARAIYESLALKYRYALENLTRIAGRAVDRIYILGGGSKNELLNQFTADACGVSVLTGIPEASVAGNLLCQLYGDGEMTSEREAKAVLRRSFALTVRAPRERRKWDAKYEAFLRATGLRPAPALV